MNRNRGNLKGGKCSRYNCLVDLTFSDSLNTQSSALALTHLKLMLYVKRTQGPKCLKERKRRPTGENNPQARMTFSFSGSHLSAAALKENLRGDGHCGIYSAVDQLQQQGCNTSLQSLRTDVAAFLRDNEYAWSHFPQDDAPDWALLCSK